MAVLLAFAVGYCAMVRHVPVAGAFYAYISAGLGRIVGLGASFMILTCYFAIGIGAYAFTGLVCAQFLVDVGGPVIEWWVFSLFFWAVVSILAYFHVAVSMKVLGILLAFEIVVVLWFDVAVLFQANIAGALPQVMSSEALFSGNVGVGLIFTILLFLGFEATAIYRDETRNPETTIPRATNIVVLFIGLFYAVSSFCMIAGLTSVQMAALSDLKPTEIFFEVGARYCGPWFFHVVSVLVLTSVFAADLAVHNVATRYIYSLSTSGVLAHGLGRAHPRFHSPYRASMLVSALYLIATAGLVYAGFTADQLYAWLAGAAAFGLICAMAATSLSAVMFFRREPVADDRWRTLQAPAIAFVCLCVMIYLGFENLPMLIGGSRGLANTLVGVGLLTFVLGMGYAYWLLIKRPEIYRKIGH
jgi:amino acid transporter